MQAEIYIKQARHPRGYARLKYRNVYLRVFDFLKNRAKRESDTPTESSVLISVL